MAVHSHAKYRRRGSASLHADRPWWALPVREVSISSSQCSALSSVGSLSFVQHDCLKGWKTTWLRRDDRALVVRAHDHSYRWTSPVAYLLPEYGEGHSICLGGGRRTCRRCGERPAQPSVTSPESHDRRYVLLRVMIMISSLFRLPSPSPQEELMTML